VVTGGRSPTARRWSDRRSPGRSPDGSTPGSGPRRTLTAVDDDAPVWNFSAYPDVGRFWPRRQAQETAVHRWDAQRAVGEPEPIEPGLAADGIDELLEVWGTMILGGRDGIDIGGSVRLVATDGPAEPWTLWTDDGVFSVSRSDGGVTADVTVRGLGVRPAPWSCGAASRPTRRRPPSRATDTSSTAGSSWACPDQPDRRRTARPSRVAETTPRVVIRDAAVTGAQQERVPPPSHSMRWPVT
jgi:hypothetical protein